MDLDELNNEQKPKTWGEYFKQYVLESIMLGFFFGIGHFLAFQLLKLKPFNDLKMLTRK